MSNQFLKLRRSAVPGKIPETSSLDLGELAINTFDGQLFLKKSGSQGPIVTVVGSTGSFTGSFTGNGAGLINIPASGITGLNLSRIATGSVTASVNTDISASFRITSGSNTLLNVTRDGQLWLGNGTFTNQAYQLDIQGNALVSGNIRVANGAGNIYSRISTVVNFVGSGAPVGIELPYVDGSKSATGFLYADNNYFTPVNLIGWNGFGVGIKNGILSTDITGVPSALLSLSSATQGFLAPRMTAAQRTAISTPAQGLLVYDTGSATEGLWFYNSGSNPGWQEVLTNSGSQSISGSITASAALITGTLTAQTLVVQTITSSILYSSGSNIFGNRLTDTQQFTGSVLITGSTVSLTGGSFSGSGANLYGIPASGITGLNLSRIATGSISASVNTDITASFRLVNGSNTLLNVTRDGYVWIGNGTIANESYQLDVNGTTRVNGDLTLKDRVIFDTLTKGIQLISGFPHEPSILIGSQNSGYPTIGNRHLMLGVANSINTSASMVTNIGFTNNLSAHTTGLSTVIGIFNTLGANAGTLYPLLIGGSNNFSPTTAIAGTPSGLLIGTGNTSTFGTSAAIGWNNTVTAANQLIFGYSQNNVNTGGWTDVYFGTGVRSGNQNLLGKDVTINSSGAGSGTDLTGGALILAGGKSTGAAISPDVIFATATTLTTGTTLQSLTNRWWVKGTSGTLSNVSNPPSASLYVSGSFIVNGAQFNNTSSLTVAGITTVSQLSTSSYTSCFYNYTVASASNARSGQVMTVWNGNSLRYIEVVTTDIGDTNLVAVSASLSSGFVRLQVSASSGWTFKNISNLL
jgi:hypothetical protein